MTEFLFYDTLKPVRKANSMMRGDDVQIQFDHDLGASSAISEARFSLRDSADLLVLQLTLEDHASQWDFTTSDEGILWIKDTDTFDPNDSTQQLEAGIYDFDIEIIGADGTTRTPIYGTITLIQDTTYDGAADNQALSYASRNDLTLQLDDLASTWPYTWTEAAASSGASTITVKNAANFSNSDTVRVAQDDGTYLETTITVSGSTFTLADALTDDVAARSIVRKVV